MQTEASALFRVQDVLLGATPRDDGGGGFRGGGLREGYHLPWSVLGDEALYQQLSRDLVTFLVRCEWQPFLAGLSVRAETGQAKDDHAQGVLLVANFELHALVLVTCRDGSVM